MESHGVYLVYIDKSIDSLKTLEMTMGNTWDFDQNLGGDTVNTVPIEIWVVGF